MGIGNKYAQGFTLLELLVVIALMSVIFTVLSVSFSDNGRAARTTALELEAALKKTRLDAMFRGRSSKFTALENKRGYVISAGQDVVSEHMFKAEDVSIDLLNGDHISFYPNGRSNGGDIKISVQHGTVYLFVDPLTGLVEVQ